MKQTLIIVLTTFMTVSCIGLDDKKSNNDSDDKGGVISQKSNGTPSFDYQVETIALPVSGRPAGNSLHFGLWKGDMPNVIYRANPDSSVDIAWLDIEDHSIRLTQINADGSLIADFKLEGLPKITSLLGFTKITTDNSYGVAYATTHDFPRETTTREGTKKTVIDKVGYFHIARVDSTGQKMWTKYIFGKEYTTPGHSFNPGSSSSGRLIYDQKHEALVSFIGKNRRFRWKSHQGSSLGVHHISDGQGLSGKDWMISHDYDMRLEIDEGKYYIFGHGDHGPLGLYAAAWQLGNNPKGDGMNLSRPLSPTTYSKAIKANRGLNLTNHSLGDVLKLGNGKFISVFARGKDKFERKDRGIFNVYFTYMEAKAGKENSYSLSAKTKKLTNAAKFEDNDNVRIAKYGKNFLVAWHKMKKPYAYIGEYDIHGDVLSEPKMIDGVVLNAMYGFITLPNGNVFWATPSKDNNRQFDLYIIKHK